jgi:hypothetical protein
MLAGGFIAGRAASSDRVVAVAMTVAAPNGGPTRLAVLDLATMRSQALASWPVTRT